MLDALHQTGEESKKEEGVGKQGNGILWLRTAGDLRALRPPQSSAVPQREGRVCVKAIDTVLNLPDTQMSWGRRGHGVELGVELVLRIKQNKNQKKKKNHVSSGGKEKLSKKGKVIRCELRQELFMPSVIMMSATTINLNKMILEVRVLMQVLGWGCRGETQKVN